MRIIHFSDLHLGIDTIGKIDRETALPVRVLDVIAALDQVVNYVEEWQPDLVLFGGDAYHRNMPSPTLVDAFSQRILRMSYIAPVVMVLGNHDMFGLRSKKTALDLFQSLESPDIYVGNSAMNFDLGDVIISTLPYPSKGMIQEELENELERLNGELEGRDVYKLLLAHCTVEGCTYGTERTLTLGNELYLPLDALYATSYDYVGLGHIHVLQDLGDENRSVIYPGSLIQLDFSDEGKETGFLDITLDGDSCEIDFVPIQSRQFFTAEINDNRYDPTDLAMDWADLNAQLLEGAIVRVLITVEDEYPVRIEDILKYYYGLGCMSCVVNVKRARQTRSNALSGKSISSLTESQLLKIYLKDQGIKGNQLKDMVLLAKEIMNESTI